MIYDKQCSSCGGFCGRGGCKRENVKPEPVAVVTSQTGDPAITMSWHHEPALPIGTKLYAAPPARKPLSYMEACTFIALNIEGGVESLEMQSQLVDLIRAVERAHGISDD